MKKTNKISQISYFFPIFPSAPWGVENVNQLNWSWPTDQLQI